VLKLQPAVTSTHIYINLHQPTSTYINLHQPTSTHCTDSALLSKCIGRIFPSTKRITELSSFEVKGGKNTATTIGRSHGFETKLSRTVRELRQKSVSAGKAYGAITLIAFKKSNAVQAIFVTGLRTGARGNFHHGVYVSRASSLSTQA
jgi:hypothetical protein